MGLFPYHGRRYQLVRYNDLYYRIVDWHKFEDKEKEKFPIQLSKDIIALDDLSEHEIITKYSRDDGDDNNDIRNNLFACVLASMKNSNDETSFDISDITIAHARSIESGLVLQGSMGSYTLLYKETHLKLWRLNSSRDHQSKGLIPFGKTENTWGIYNWLKPLSKRIKDVVTSTDIQTYQVQVPRVGYKYLILFTQQYGYY